MVNHNGSSTWLAERLELLTHTSHPPTTELGGLLTKLWRGKWIILLCGLIGLIAAVYFCQFVSPNYESTAQVYVRAKRPEAMHDASFRKSAVRDDTATHIALVQSPSFIRRAVELRNLDQLSSLANEPDVVGAIIGSLAVGRGQDKITQDPTNVIYFSYRGPVADDCGAVLAAVIESFEKFLDESISEEHEFALSVIEDKVNSSQTSIDTKKEQLRRLQTESLPDWMANENAVTIQFHMGELEKQKTQLQLRITETQRRIDAIKLAAKDENKLAEFISLLPANIQTNGSKWIDERLFSLMTRKRELMMDFGEGHPEVQTINEQIQLARELASTQSANRDEILSQSSEQGWQQAKKLANVYLASLQQEINEADGQKKMLADLVIAGQKKLKQLANHEYGIRQLTQEIVRFEDSHQKLLEQKREVELDKQFVGYAAQLIAAPRKGKKIFPIPMIVYLVGGFLGVNLGIALALCLDAVRDSRQPPQPIEVELGLPVFGYVPHLRSVRRGNVKLRSTPRIKPDRSICTIHHPTSAEAESYRSLRTTLASLSENELNGVIQITAVNEAQISAVVAANLAVAMAQSGKNVLLVDANIRAPQINRLFDVGVKQGLESAALETAELDDVIFETSIDGLSILASGVKSSPQPDLLATPAFGQILHRAREQFDLVLVNTSDLSSNGDAKAVAQKTDGVILTVVKSVDDRLDAMRGATELEKIDIDVLGVIVCTQDFQPAQQAIEYTSRFRTSASGLTRV